MFGLFRIRIGTSLVAALLLWLCAGAAVRGAEDRLSHSDWGLYGGVGMGYYSSEECPFSLFILQCHAPAEPGFVAKLNQQLAAIDAAGRKAICYIWFWKDYAEKDGKAPLPSVDEVMSRLDTILPSLDRERVYAITLAEENIWWSGRADLLADLYRAVKARYPQLRVFQWYSGGAPGPAGFGTPYLPADGWVIDEYSMSGDRLEHYLAAVRAMEMEAVIVCWATSSWGGITWKPQRLEEQIAAARKYDVPVTFFSVSSNDLRDKQGAHVGHTWAWNMTEDLNDPVAWETFKMLSKRAAEIGSRKFSIDFNDESLQHSMSRGPIIAVPDKAGGVFAFSSQFNSGNELSEAQIDGRLHLRWRPGRIWVRRDPGTPAASSLTYHFVALDGTALKDIEAEARVALFENTGQGPFELAMSFDGGETWPVSKTAEPTGTSDDAPVKVRAPGPASAAWVRLRLTPEQSLAPDAVSAVRFVGFRARVAGKIAKVIRLRSDDKGEVRFVEDFRSQRMRLSASLRDSESMEWSPGSVSVGGRQGGTVHAAIEQRFAADRPMDSIRVTAHVGANIRDLGGDVALAASPDGKRWSATVKGSALLAEGERAYNGPLTLDLSDDPRFRGIRSLVIRVELLNSCGVQTAPSSELSAIEILANCSASR